MEVLEASTYADSGNLHLRPLKFSLTSMEVNLLPILLPCKQVETSMEAHRKIEIMW